MVSFKISVKPLSALKMSDTQTVCLDQYKQEFDQWKSKLVSVVDGSDSFAELTEKLSHLDDPSDLSLTFILVNLANKVRKQTLAELSESSDAPSPPDIENARRIIGCELEPKFAEKFSKEILQKCGFAEDCPNYVSTCDDVVEILQHNVSQCVCMAMDEMSQCVSVVLETIDPSAERKSDDDQNSPKTLKESVDLLRERASGMTDTVLGYCSEVVRQREEFNSLLEAIGNEFLKELGMSLGKVLSHSNEIITALVNFFQGLTETIKQLSGRDHGGKSNGEILENLTDMSGKFAREIIEFLSVNHQIHSVVRDDVCRFLEKQSDVLTECCCLPGTKHGKLMELDPEDWAKHEPVDEHLFGDAIQELLHALGEVIEERNREV